MGHSDSLKDVPNVDSKEFEKFLKDNGFDKKLFTEDFTNKLEDALNNSLKEVPEKESIGKIVVDIKEEPKPEQPKKESIGKTIFNIVDNWCMKNPRPALIIFLGGSAFICYKLTVGILSQAVFKGNLKTSRYFDKHVG